MGRPKEKGKEPSPPPSRLVSRPKGRTIRKVIGAGGGGGFSACTNFFFRSLLLQEYFFSGEHLCTKYFFSDKYCFFLNSEVSIHYLCFCAL